MENKLKILLFWHQQILVHSEKMGTICCKHKMAVYPVGSIDPRDSISAKRQNCNAIFAANNRVELGTYHSFVSDMMSTDEPTILEYLSTIFEAKFSLLRAKKYSKTNYI